MNLAALMQDHHKYCDTLFADAEDALRNGHWQAGQQSLATFAADLERHLTAEEEILFPAFEQATGMMGGPTRVMRFEHGQMRELLAQMTTAAQARDADEFAGVAETLLILMQQHNAKEENMLYPMCDTALDAQSESLGALLDGRLRALDLAA